MKSAFRRYLGALAVVLLFCGIASAETPLNLLFFGNSFTQGGESKYVPDAVRRIAAADGYAMPTVVADLAGGTTLDYHYSQVTGFPSNNVTNSALPSGDTWDYVIMQGHSTDALNATEFQRDALRLYQSVVNHSSGKGAGVTGVLYQTWARGDMTNSTTYTMDDMTADIVEGYQGAHDGITQYSGDGSCRIGTVGQAFQAADYDATLYDNKFYHLRRKGYTLAALILYRTIYNEDVSDIAYADVKDFVGSSYVSETDWAQIVGWADAAPIVTPEPASMSLLALGSLAVVIRRRRK